MLTYIFNPFSKINAKAMMLFGIIITVVGAFTAYFQKTTFDSMFNVSLDPFITYAQAITSNLIAIIIPCFVLFIFAKKMNPNVKMLDILNTSFYYRIPIYLLTFSLSNSKIKDLQLLMNKDIDELKNIAFSVDDIVIMSLFAVFALAMFAYSIILLFNGFKKASGAHKWTQYLAFFVSIVISEFLIRLISFYL